MMEISSLNSQCAKHIHHPDNGGKANQSAERENFIRHACVAASRGNTSEMKRNRGFSFFFSSLFLFKFGKTNDPLQVSLIFMLVFLGWTSCPLLCLIGFYELLCQRVCMSSKEHLLCHLALTSLCCLLSELPVTRLHTVWPKFNI